MSPVARSDDPRVRPFEVIGPDLGWCIAIVVAAMTAWLVVLLVMAGMDEGPGTPLHDFPTFLAGWIVMLTAMMLPSEIRYIRVFANAAGRATRPGWRPAVMIAAFVSGYAIAWTGYGTLAFVLDAALREWAAGVISWFGIGPLLAGIVLVLAGLYQVSPLKRACLTHCRAPVSYFARHWRPGGIGALRMGIGHGLVCVGCCWALMAVMFAVGAMSLIWMGLLGLMMFAEKILPRGHRLALPIALFLWVMGFWIALAPDSAPLLTDPLLYGSLCRTF